MANISTIGGASIGWVSATWPLAKLAVSPSLLKLSGVLGSYEFAPSDVVSLEVSGSIPLLSSSIRIVHTRPDYPWRVLFFGGERPEKLIAKIRAAGFVPAASAALAVRSGKFPVRWSAILFLIILWNGLFFADQQLPGAGPHNPGPLAFLALALAFAISWTASRSSCVQSLLMRDGESVGRIKPFLLLVQVVSGLLLAVFAVTFLSRVLAG
jgi:hypothetical protein